MAMGYEDRMMSHAGKTTWPDVGPQAKCTGTISFWNAEKGFGFIQRDDGRPDLFCHINEVVEDVEALSVGTTVAFVPGTSKRTNKPQAQDVRVIEQN